MDVGTQDSHRFKAHLDRIAALEMAVWRWAALWYAVNLFWLFMVIWQPYRPIGDDIVVLGLLGSLSAVCSVASAQWRVFGARRSWRTQAPESWPGEALSEQPAFWLSALPVHMPLLGLLLFWTYLLLL